MVFLVVDRKMQKHECPWPTYHIETPKRLETIIDRLENTNLVSDPNIDLIPSRLATKSEIATVHTSRYIEDIESTENMTIVSRSGAAPVFHLVLYLLIDENGKRFRTNKNNFAQTAGSAIDLTNRVFDEKSSGLALVRPPGHHASPDEGCGFCIFNNVAIAAKNALHHGAKRVLIVDYDVHAGQGTQECVDGDENIRLISIHRYENGTFWPNLEQAGVEHKFSNTLNVPLNGISFTDSDYLAIFTLVVLPVLGDWQPDLIIVSCGFDAALGDPEGYMKVTPAGYATMTRMLTNTGVPVAAILEGGYFLDSIAADAEWVVRAFLGQQVPVLEFEKLDPRLAVVISALHKRYQHEYPSFTNFSRIREVLRSGDEDQKFDDFAVFKGERTVCVPYDTRGYYTPFTEEVVELYRKELNGLIGGYKDGKVYETIKHIVPDLEAPQLLKHDEDGTLHTSPEVESLLSLLVALPLNPLLRVKTSRTTILATTTLTKLAESLKASKNVPLFENLPIFQL